MNPTRYEYGLVAWLRTQYRDLLKEGWYSGFFHDGATHVLVIRWLLWLPIYAAYVEWVKAHEWGHSQGLSHEEDSDLMGPRAGNGWETDKHDVYARSAVWRAEPGVVVA